MLSLRRLLSLECADASPPPLQLSSCRSKLSRHSSLPILSPFKPQGLPSFPSPCKPRQRSSRHGILLCSPSCGFKQEGTHRKLTSFRSVPAWPTEYEGDFCVQAATSSPSRQESVQMEDSVVYRELCESIPHLEMPQRIGCTLQSLEGFLRPSVQDGNELCKVEETILGLSSSDVRGRPLSLRMLKRNPKPKVNLTFPLNRQVSPSYSFKFQVEDSSLSASLAERVKEEGRNGLLSDVTGSVNSAIATLVFMMESLQDHTLRLRRVLTSEADARLQAMMEKVHQEMQETFLWLFQKVFACTPRLMLLTMMLLVDFAAHSMGKHVALAVMPMGEPPTCAIERSIATSPSSMNGVTHLSRMDRMLYHASHSSDTHISSEVHSCEGGAGDGVIKVVKVGGGMDGEADPSAFADGAAMTAEDDTHAGLIDVSEVLVLSDDSSSKSDTGVSSGSRKREEQRVLSTLWQQAVSKEMNRMPFSNARHILVAPVRAPALEADDYACYDRTDLSYQYELSRDSSNPLLLSNYAQFLHVVRHDHDRAEELYKRAVKADPVDGELIGKYASFLWVARDNIDAADEAYKAALTVDPSNAYHAGSYAHFLWNSGTDEDDVPCPAPSYLEVSTS